MIRAPGWHRWGKRDERFRTCGTLEVAEHLRPPHSLQHLDCCPRYIRLPMPFAIPWAVDWVDLEDATGLTIEGEA
jgi:hypothetical protein